MAGGMDLGDSGKGKKKPLDATINLVPFIDLMAVTISFLIMTAVWTQIGRLQVSSAGGPSAEAAEQEDKSMQLTLRISDRELSLVADGAPYGEPMEVQRDKDGRIQLKKLHDQLTRIRDARPDQANITIEVEDAVKYDDLVRVIDQAKIDKLPNVLVSAAG
ncbi:MAG: ExbD/TolR family protein [Myxococcaceae bacterium]